MATLRAEDLERKAVADFEAYADDRRAHASAWPASCCGSNATKRTSPSSPTSSASKASRPLVVDAMMVAQARGLYARALWEVDPDRPGALALAREAADTLSDRGDFADTHVELRAWLETHATAP